MILYHRKEITLLLKLVESKPLVSASLLLLTLKMHCFKTLLGFISQRFRELNLGNSLLCSAYSSYTPYPAWFEPANLTQGMTEIRKNS